MDTFISTSSLDASADTPLLSTLGSASVREPALIGPALLHQQERQPETATAVVTMAGPLDCSPSYAKQSRSVHGFYPHQAQASLALQPPAHSSLKDNHLPSSGATASMGPNIPLPRHSLQANPVLAAADRPMYHVRSLLDNAASPSYLKALGVRPFATILPPPVAESPLLLQTHELYLLPTDSPPFAPARTAELASCVPYSQAVEACNPAPPSAFAATIVG